MQGMNQSLLLLPFLWLCATVCHAFEIHATDDSQIIVFDEPVVHLRDVHKEKPDNITICGDNEHQPQCCWIDQDTLCVRFQPGTSVSTKYKLTFKPEHSHYLGGEPISPAQIELSCPPAPLSADKPKGTPEPAVCVYPTQRISREAIHFSPEAAVQYEFREIKRTTKKITGYGRSIPGKAHPATLRQIPDTRAALQQLKQLRADWQQVSGHTVVPGFVIVQPVEALDPTSSWELRILPAADSAFTYEEPQDDALENRFHFIPDKELRTQVFQFVSRPTEEEKKKGEKPGMRLKIGFSAPMSKADLPALFSKMTIRCGSQTAENAADGKEKHLTLDGKKVTFRLLDEPGETPPGLPIHENHSSYIVSYDSNPLVEAMFLEISDMQPADIDIIIPQGTQSALGLTTRCDHLHRLSICPAYPQLGLGVPQLPLHGDHHFRFLSTNAESVEMQAWHINAAQFLRMMTEGQDMKGMDVNKNTLEWLQFRLKAEEKRLSVVPGTKADDGIGSVRSIRNSIRYTERKEQSKREKIHAFLSPFKSFTPQRINIPHANDNILLTSRETAVNLDTLTGGNTQAGFYIIRLTPKANTAVRRLSEEMGAAPAIFETPHYLALQVTDLCCTASGDTLLLTHLHNGKPVETAEIRTPDAHIILVNGGICSLSAAEAAQNRMLAIAGDDYTPIQTNTPHRTRENGSIRQELFTDRPLYRPGDTVHLRGLVRSISPQGESRIEPSIRQLRLEVRKPDREVLLQRDICPDEFGAWSDCFTLAEREDDTTGHYLVRVSIPGHLQATHQTSINCQVFRRDAFEASLKTKIEPIAPRAFTVNINATDLNGAPLHHAEVELRLNCSDKLLSLSPNEAPDTFITTKARTDAQGRLSICGHIAPAFSPESAGTAHLTISATIANDRQEYRKLEPEHITLYAADFVPVLRGKNLYLFQATQPEKALAREQKLHVRIMARKTQREELAGGLSISRSSEQCIFDKEVVIPSDSKDGFPLPLDDSDQEEISCIQIKGSDPAGRELACQLPWHPWWRTPSNRQGENKLTVQDSALEWHIDDFHSGEALLFLHSRRGTRSQWLTLKGGEESLRIPLQADENGELRCQLLQWQKDEKGLYTQCHSIDAHCNIPRADMQLQVQLDTPQQAVRPGSDISVSGRVTRPDGLPAEAVVTLFAVDTGMLSVAPYTLPDWEQVFGRVQLPYHSFRTLYQAEKEPAYLQSFVIMAPVWKGDIIGEGGSIPYAELILPSAFRQGSRVRGIYAAMGGHIADEEAEDAAAPMPVMASAAVNRSAKFAKETGSESDAEEVHIRTNFAPVAVWQSALKTDANGRFRTEFKLPDTLTTWRVFAVAADKNGQHFGNGEADFQAQLPVMLTPGTPFFMSVGDSLKLPLTITNNSGQDATWQVHLEPSGSTQSINLKTSETNTLFFDFTAEQAGESTLTWAAVSDTATDAVSGTFPIRFPAPTLKETHHLVLEAGAPPLAIATLPAPEMAQAPHSHTEIEISANPLLHLASCMDFMLSYPYGCTEQTASALLPWLFHQRLAPFSPTMAATDTATARKHISQSINALLRRQQPDGGLSYWGQQTSSCLWASAHAALVFTIAAEQGYDIPAVPMQKLQQYLTSRSEEELQELPALSRYAIGRACQNEKLADEALQAALSEQQAQPRHPWCNTPAVTEDLRFISALRREPTNRHTDFLHWLRSRGHDYRHQTTWRNAWMLIALGEYLRQEQAQDATATVQLQDGKQITLNNGLTRITLPQAGTPAQLPTSIATTHGTAYLNIKFRATPQRTEYSGLTEKGLQVTRVYEKQDANGNWVAAEDFKVGDVVRITLTCAKVAEELHYLVLEDYLPANMEAINPRVPGQAAGLPWQSWSHWFDHKEYLADRVRGFCTRWGDRNLLNMSYYARVKRAGTATAPPAQAQLMYEPQIYGLSPNAKISAQ